MADCHGNPVGHDYCCRRPNSKGKRPISRLPFPYLAVCLTLDVCLTLESGSAWFMFTLIAGINPKPTRQFFERLRLNGFIKFWRPIVRPGVVSSRRQPHQ